MRDFWKAEAFLNSEEKKILSMLKKCCKKHSSSCVNVAECEDLWDSFVSLTQSEQKSKFPEFYEKFLKITSD